MEDLFWICVGIAIACILWVPIHSVLHRRAMRQTMRQIMEEHVEEMRGGWK